MMKHIFLLKLYRCKGLNLLFLLLLFTLLAPAQTTQTGYAKTRGRMDSQGNLIPGTRIGGVQISEKHGNFIVNRWDGSADDARRLIEWTQEKVLSLEQIRLEPEVRFIGEFI